MINKLAIFFVFVKRKNFGFNYSDLKFPANLNRTCQTKKLHTHARAKKNLTRCITDGSLIANICLFAIFSFLFHLPNTATAAFLTFAECNFAIEFLFYRKESNLLQITSYPFSAQRKPT